jgi:epoxyqueuosine reductase
MRATELAQLAEELGIDVVGAAPAEPYAETERHIADRRRLGYFADMRFTMAQPELSCHPEALLPGARTVVSAASCYYAPGPEPQAGQGRLPRYAWRDHYADLRERLDALGRRLGGAYRVLVDANQHVDRAGAVRSGVGFFGKNTMVITERYGSWVVLGTLVTDVEIEPTPSLELDCGRCTLCIDACPTDAIVEPGVLDSRLCLSYWTQAPAPIPEGLRAELGDQVYGCDICQDVDALPVVSLVDWLERPGEDLAAELDRLYVPRNDPRWLRRNALVALGNTGRPGDAAAAEAYADGDDPMLAETAGWALGRLAERS